MKDVKIEFEEYPVGHGHRYKTLSLDDAISGYGAFTADLCRPDVTITTHEERIEKLEGQIVTLIRAVSTLINDNETLKKDNAFLIDKVKELEEANFDREAEIVKTSMEIKRIETDFHTTIAELVNAINEKLDKA